MKDKEKPKRGIRPPSLQEWLLIAIGIVAIVGSVLLMRMLE